MKHMRQHTIKQTTSSHHIVPPKAQFSPIQPITQPSTSQLHHNDFAIDDKMMSKGLVNRITNNVTCFCQ